MLALQSIIELFKIKKSERTIDINKTSGVAVINFYFYENLLSPFVTGVITVESTGNAVKDNDDKQMTYLGKVLSVGDEVLINVSSPVGPGINYSSEQNPYKRLYISELQGLQRSSTKNVTQIRVTSKIAIVNETVKVGSNINGKISDSVKNILTGKFEMTKDDFTIDGTSNSVELNGMSQKPVNLLGILARQSIPATPKGKANPGFFFYETKSGFKFKSISSIIDSKKYKKVYHYNGKTPNIDSSENLYKAARLDVLKNQEIIGQIKSGVYASKNIFYNPAQYKFTEIDISVGEDKLIKDKDFTALGKKDKLETPKVVLDDIKKGKISHRIQTSILNVDPQGDNPIDKSDPNSISNSPEMYYAAGSTRYNILFSQKVAITIPCNTDLEVGMKLELQIENIAYCTGINGSDEELSGQYIIQALAHYADNSNRAITSLELIRDSYGLHFSTDTSGDTSESVLLNGGYGTGEVDERLTAEEQAYKNMENSGRSAYLGGGL